MPRGGRHGQQSLPQGQLRNYPGVSSQLEHPACCSRRHSSMRHSLPSTLWPTKRLVSVRWVWTGMSTDITPCSRNCQFCQQAKVTLQPLASVQQMPILARQLSHIHLDLVGPLPRSKEGFNHCSRWWTTLFTGWKLFHLKAPAPQPSPVPSSAVGWPALVSLWTAALSSAQHSGVSCHSAWALFTTSPPPTILRPMEWWRKVTAYWRTPQGLHRGRRMAFTSSLGAPRP